MSGLAHEFGAELLFGKAEDMDAIADLIVEQELTLPEVLLFLRAMAVRLRASSDATLRAPS